MPDFLPMPIHRFITVGMELVVSGRDLLSWMESAIYFIIIVSVIITVTIHY